MSEQLTNNQSVSESIEANETNNPETSAVEVEQATSEKAHSETEEVTKVSETQQVIDTLQQEVASLKQQLAEQTEKTESFKAQYIRIAADFDNFRKRTSKEKESLEYQVKKNTLNELLPVIDNFERARTQIKPNTEPEKNIHKSYQGVYKILVESLKRIGVSPMRPEGEPFDPNYHEAMLREPTDQYPEGTVIEELMRGYLLDEQVLRHAMVKVAAPKETEEEETSESTIGES